MDSPGKTISAAPSPSWTVTTNWTIARGSLSNSVTVDSSFSLLDDDVDVVVDSNSAPPLILYPPALDSSPCAITITFQQKHEVRQVYLRSTARVYEMYYTNNCQSDHEYLGTVRCGIATRDGQVLHAIGVEEAVLAHQSCSRKESDEGELRSSSNLSTNEDDWVEVKAFGASQPVRKNVSLFENCDTGPRRSLELHEATAEIADASPCVSFTLRLLSLKNKGCVCIDEVYMFADPVDECNVDNQLGPGANSTGNSLMAMLVPTILQMSKTKLGEDKCNKIATQKQNAVEIGSKAIDPINFPTKVQQEINSGSADMQEVKLQDAAGSSAVPVLLGTSQEVPDIEEKHGKSSSYADSFLDQLVSRVNRIEDLLLGFQEKLLKPINSIDERLQRVEQQLDALTRNSQNSEFVSCTRISAPEFSCCESESNSYQSGCVDLGYVACETNKDLPAISDSSDITLVSVNATEIHPSLAVSAPEVSNCDNDNENHVAEMVKEYPGNKQKRAISIDDAVASALAGFLTSTSGQSQICFPTLAVKAPDFPTEEESNSEKSASPRIRINPAICDEDSSIFLTEPKVMDCMRCLFSDAAPNSSLSGGENVEKYSDDENLVKGGRIAFERQLTLDQVDSQCIYDCHEVASCGDFATTDNIVDHMNSPEASDDIHKIFYFEETGGLAEIFENQTDGRADTTQERAVLDESASAEVSEGGAQKDILSDIIGFARIAAVPDYANIPILEVEFLSEENLKMKSPIEALLSGTSDLTIQVPYEEEISEYDTQIAMGEGSNLIMMEDWGTASYTSSSLITVDVDYYSLRDIPKDVEADNLHGSYECCCSQEMSAGSLI